MVCLVRAMRMLCALWLLAAAPALAASRVVSLNLCTDQLLVLLAPEKVAGLTPLVRDPSLSFVAERAADLPVVRASAEAVLERHPDLVIGAPVSARSTLDLLRQLGVNVALIDLPTDFPGIRAVVKETAALLGLPDRAAALIAGMDAALPPPGPPLRALAWQPRGWTDGPGSLMDAVLRAAGMVNVGSGRRVGLEALLRDPPDLLVLPELPPGASLATDLLTSDAIRFIPVRAIPTPLTICAGPFTARAVARLVR